MEVICVLVALVEKIYKTANYHMSVFLIISTEKHVEQCAATSVHCHANQHKLPEKKTSFMKRIMQISTKAPNFFYHIYHWSPSYNLQSTFTKVCSIYHTIFNWLTNVALSVLYFLSSASVKHVI